MSKVSIFLLTITLANQAFAQSLVTDQFLEKREKDKIPFIHSKTYEGKTAYETGRVGSEIEATFRVQCKNDNKELRKELFQELSKDKWKKFKKLRRCKTCEAYSYGHGIDYMSWTEEHHQIREANPYMAFSIMGDRTTNSNSRYRFDFDDEDPRDGKNEIFYSTDLFDDWYFDTPDFTLTRNNYVLRGRKRWNEYKDESESVRVLYAYKKVLGVNPESGIKDSFKTDQRWELSRDYKTADPLVNLIPNMQGRLENSDLSVIQKFYDQLKKDKIELPSTSKYENVLALDEKAFLRSLRSRYHLFQTSLHHLANLNKNGFDVIENLSGLLAGYTKNKNLTPKEQEVVDYLVSLNDFNKITNEIVTKVNKKLVENNLTDKQIEPKDYDEKVLVYEIKDENQIEVQKIIAEAASEYFHEVGAKLRLLIESDFFEPSEGIEGMDLKVSWFEEWILSGIDNYRRNEDSYSNQDTVRSRSTYQYWLKEYNRIVGIQNVRGQIIRRTNEEALKEKLEDFNRFLSEKKKSGDDRYEDYQNISRSGLFAYQRLLNKKMAPIWARQIESAGTIYQTLWFDAKRNFHMGKKVRRRTFAIFDTFDLTGFFKKDVWEGIDVKDQLSNTEMDKNKLYWSEIVNEVQIELETYLIVDKIKYLTDWKKYSIIHVLYNKAIELYRNDLVTYGDRYNLENIVKGYAENKFDIKDLNEFAKSMKYPYGEITIEQLKEMDVKNLSRIYSDRLYDGFKFETDIEKKLKELKEIHKEEKRWLTVLAKMKEKQLKDNFEKIEDGKFLGCSEFTQVEKSKGQVALELIQNLEK